MDDATSASASTPVRAPLPPAVAKVPRRSPSIRRALLLRLSVPLFLLAAAGSLSTYLLAQRVSEQVLDEWLYDSAIALSKQVRTVGGSARLDLPRPALDILEWDTVDRFFYDVDSSTQGPMLANVRLPEPKQELSPDGQPVYYDARAGVDNVRAVAFLISLPNGEELTVKVAETRRKRKQQNTEVVSATVAVSVLLVLASAWLVWFAVGSGVSSLAQAIRLIRQQQSRTGSVTPLEREPVPLEVQPLVDEIHQLVEELSAAHRSNQRFVGNTAHQLRTPVAAMRVQLESARRLNDLQSYAKAVDSAVPELTRLSHLLHQLLTLARVDEQHAGVSDMARVDVAALARQEVERRFDKALQLGVDVGYDGPSGSVFVRGKDALLREVISNLLDNALRYGAHPGSQLTVSVRADPPEISVQDDGPGIPTEELEKVRERYYRLAGNDTEGSGLGLAIVDEVAQRHGARFILEPGPHGKGLNARFVFGHAA